MKNFIYLILISWVSIHTACETDIPNPNAATEDDLLNSADGLTGLAVGIQLRFISSSASPLYSAITASGLTTNELTVLNAGNSEIAALENGGDNVTSANGVITNLWTTLSLTISDAQKLMDNAGNLSDAGISAGVRAYGLFFKSLALGTVAEFWEQGVINTVSFESGENASFSQRTDVLNEAIALLNEASGLTGSISEDFYSAVGTNIDFPNSINALLARYNLMLGNYDQALTNAGAVDLGVRSEFIFDNVTPNPVFNSSLSNQNTYETQDDGSMGLPPSLAVDRDNDERYPFYIFDNGSGFNATGFFTGDEASIPLYLPGEMLLVMAEAHARQNRLTEAVAELDKVLTKTAVDDAFGLGANLPPYSGAMDQDEILTEIYRNRAIEMYMSGLKLEDSRRFNRPGYGETDEERNRDFYPYPNVEIDNNPNTPPNPPI